MPTAVDETVRSFFNQLSAPSAAENAAIIRQLDVKRCGIATIYSLAAQGLFPGQTTLPRFLANGSTGVLTTGRMQLSRFTARRTELISTIAAVVHATAAATVTLIRYGIYTIDNTTGDFTLVASTANDATLLAATNTRYSKALSTPYVLIGGQDYALAVLVSATTMPVLAGQTFVAADLQSFPIPALHVAAADLPATQTFAGCTASTMLIYGEMI